MALCMLLEHYVECSAEAEYLDEMNMDCFIDYFFGCMIYLLYFFSVTSNQSFQQGIHLQHTPATNAIRRDTSSITVPINQ